MTSTGTLTPALRLTGLKPTGPLHIGNLVGAIDPLVAAQGRTPSILFLADLHALTLTHEPAQLRRRTLEQARTLLAAGLDPAHTLCYAQSAVPQHTELHCLLECTTTYGEAHRMIQFRERAGDDRASVRLSLLSYPVLMAADILLHDATEVPVGDDQTQHLELARDVATRFNRRYGPVFTVPRAVNPPVAARVRALNDPTAKMGKSQSAANGTLYLLDPPDAIARKVRRAVTDETLGVTYDPAGRPGVANLLDLLAACTGTPPARLAPGFRTNRELKAAVAEAVIARLRPLQERYAALDDAEVRAILAEGAAEARGRTAPTVVRAREALGLT